jgi:hypothetical protein
VFWILRAEFASDPRVRVTSAVLAKNPFLRSYSILLLFLSSYIASSRTHHACLV